MGRFMQPARFEQLLAGTAIALALTLGAYNEARAATEAEISAAVPMPEIFDLPPPTIADIAAPAVASPSVAPAESRNEPIKPAAAAEVPNSVPEPATGGFVTTSLTDAALVDKL